jgi:hypothetical protein
MRVASNGNGNEVECTECNPPRRFKSKSGLNGHTQFKHGHLTDNRAVLPNGKQSQMYEDLTELVEQGFDEVRYRLDSLANVQGNGQGNGNGNGQVNGNGNGQGNGNGNGQVNGNGNGQGNGNGNGQVNGNGNGQVNGNGYNTEPIGVVSPPKDEPEEQTYFCEGCDAHGLKPGQERCGGCGTRVDWSGVAVPLDLTKSEL